MRPTRLPAALLALAALATGANAQQPFTWQGSLAAGRTIEIANLNGDVVAVAAAGSQVRVTAHKSARRSNPDDPMVRRVLPPGSMERFRLPSRPRRGRAAGPDRFVVRSGRRKQWHT